MAGSAGADPRCSRVEGGLGYVAVDYSAPQYVTSESNETTASIALFYRPGPIVRVGVGGRFERTHTPKAVVDPVDGAFRSNNTDGNNLDLLVDYTPDSLLTTNARLSYTQQTNSLLKASNFSGWTGSLSVGWQPTAKTAVRFDAARDVGFQVSSVNQYAVVQSGTGLTLTPVAVAYQNNRVTDSAGLGVTYAATAKIGATALLRYTRQRLVADIEITGITRDVDVSKSASLALNYAITRAWSASCSIAYETRDVTSLVRVLVQRERVWLRNAVHLEVTGQAEATREPTSRRRAWLHRRRPCRSATTSVCSSAHGHGCRIPRSSDSPTRLTSRARPSAPGSSRSGEDRLLRLGDRGRRCADRRLRSQTRHPG